MKYLLQDDCLLLESLGEMFEFDITVGYNSKVWVTSPKPENLIVLIKCVTMAEECLDEGPEGIKRLVSSIN